MSGNTRFATAVHIMGVIAFMNRLGETRVTSETIARSVNANAVNIRILLRALKKAGLVIAKEGKGGGIKLARSPEEISLHEIYLAVSQSSVISLRKKSALKSCPISCGIKSAMQNLSKSVDHAIATALHHRTLQNLMEEMVP